MGYNFWFNLVISKEKEDVFMNYLNNNGSIDDTGYIAKVELDKLSLDYIHCYYDDNEIQIQVEIEKKASIGYIFFEKHMNDTHPDKVAFSFMAATQYLSSLFRDSESVYRWFIELSNVSNSLLTFIDFEHFGYRIVFHKGKEVNIDIKFDNQDYDYLNTSQFKEIMDDYSILSKILY